MALVTNTKAKNYLVLPVQKPLRCNLVREQDSDEISSWSGFNVDSVYKVTWEKTEAKINIRLDSAGRRKELWLEFCDKKEVECWISDFSIQTKGFLYNAFRRE